MRRVERAAMDMELPTRYVLDEARFEGGREHICNEEGEHGPATDFA